MYGMAWCGLHPGVRPDCVRHGMVRGTSGRQARLCTAWHGAGYIRASGSGLHPFVCHVCSNGTGTPAKAGDREKGLVGGGAGGYG